MLSVDELDALRTVGYAEVRWPYDDISTLELAENIGFILDLNTVDLAYPSVQVDVLTPKEKTSKHLNRYHGNFGFEEYPAHTDLAHWFIPPRYILLRALVGTCSVKTHLYPIKKLLDFLPLELADRALFYPRVAKSVTALPFRIPRCDEFTVRSDSLFIRPANIQAKYCADILNSDSFLSTPDFVTLFDPMHAVVIDNWRCLHGRGVVHIGDRGRKIERVYLERIHGIPG